LERGINPSIWKVRAVRNKKQRSAKKLSWGGAEAATQKKGVSEDQGQDIFLKRRLKVKAVSSGTENFRN